MRDAGLDQDEDLRRLIDRQRGMNSRLLIRSSNSSASRSGTEVLDSAE
jgi:hypothetical protein